MRKWLVVTKWCFLLLLALILCLAVGAMPAAGAGGVRYVDKYVARDCGGNTPCHHSIQAAVNAAQAGDTIYVYPATYTEGVDLSQMDPEGDITLATVDANGNPAPGTVTVDNPADAPEIYTSDPPFNGDVTIDGFVLRSAYGAIDLWVGSTTLAPSGAEGRLGPALVRDVEIRNVDASHTGEDGIVVRAEGDVTITDCVANDNQGLGINAFAARGDVTIAGCTANDNHCATTNLGLVTPCYGIAVGAGGQVKISDSTANRNGGTGIGVSGSAGSQELGLDSVATPDRVIIERCTASNNDRGGIWVRTVPGDVTITDCTTNRNGDDGVHVGGVLFQPSGGAQIAVNGGDLTIRNCTSNGNGASGFDPEVIGGTVSIQACIARDNDQHGVDLDWWRMSEALLVNGSIICGNECGISLVSLQEPSESEHSANGPTTRMNFEGNWWGCPDGPEAAGCDPICQLDGLPVDFTPWIAKVSDSATVDPAVVGQPTVVSFQFSGNPSAVYLGRGPGDLRGPAPFTVSTDNGRLDGNGSTVHKFLGANGTLKVTLVPERGGTATVTVVGPCGIGELEGAEAVLGVLEEEFVPEPGTILLLGSGLMGLAGYASLRLRKR